MAFEKIFGIAACDPKGVMGSKGKLPWHCPEDVKHFSDTTFGYPMIMGYRTFLSLPARYFDQRMTVVFSHRKLLSDKNLFFVSSLTEFLALEIAFKNLYVVGGAQIYRLFLQENLIEEFLLTRFKKSYEGDTFFPLFLLNGWISSKIQETDTFHIRRYFRPLRSMMCT